MAPLSDVNHLSHPYIHGGDFSSSHSERKFGLMKWLSNLFKGGSNRGRGSHHHHLHEPAEENMSWRAPSIASDGRARSQKQKELGHAMELSSAEDLKRPNAHQGYKWGTYNDEDYYYKGLPDNLGSSAYPSHDPAPYYPRDYR
ncbi:hypothetical protein Lalb_Chr10g0104811 [Lupinus albus]|uniref:Uncharacterized protein n=1 Tax=Lupinus albus TaxID=3870 RepID=A0A6A4PWT8_LUPAL|nr:hypothetical protein Lalb_Chr10g0104811 [Lupinus albus]